MSHGSCEGFFPSYGLQQCIMDHDHGKGDTPSPITRDQVTGSIHLPWLVSMPHEGCTLPYRMKIIRGMDSSNGGQAILLNLVYIF
jgi:hypothetical protein